MGFTTDQINACEPDMPIIYSNKREYAPLELNMEDQDFYAVRLGDVNSSWTKAQSRSLSRKSERSNDFSDLPEIQVAPGDIFSVPIVLTDDQSINSALISVSFDSDIVQTQEGSIENGFLSDFQLEQEIGVADISAFIIYGSQAVQGSGKLIDLRFKAIGKNNAPLSH
ncbi:MAG: hypothetical protein OMM_12554 [Candidatus Magnetoglobus multicellularis str. Araruama]|uniref:Cohesin domain-containing protein n=1 Tax=Candidatus Magnetoglobus multicellularis str. Araruama TaxID=890399 RepID=A0A1V1NVV6_9BACT|nr:MAG: hypothetical protein OMM_12554 [Candidatus Magnetoglobus multicellularis str. Araruama]